MTVRNHVGAMGPGGAFSTDCPSRPLLEHVTSKWGILLLVLLSEGTMRWGELRDRVDGVSEKMLAQTLRTLQSDGFVDRRAHPVVPPRVDYSLTAHGEEVAALLIPLMDWVLSYAELRTPDAAEPAPR